MSTISAVMPSCLRPSAMSVGVGANQEEAPPGQVGGGDPDLLPVEDVVVAVGDGGGAQVGQVAARLGLAEALAPVVIGVEDVRDPALLLLVGAPTDDHGADLPQAVGVVDAGRAVAGHRLGVDDVLGHGGVAAAPLGRPADGGPATGVELALPGPSPLHLRQHAAPARRRSRVGVLVGLGVGVSGRLLLGPLGQELGQVLVEPVHQLGPVRLVLVGVGEVHGGIVASPGGNLTAVSGKVARRGIHPGRRPAGAAADRAGHAGRAGALLLCAGDGRRRPGRVPMPCGTGWSSSDGSGCWCRRPRVAPAWACWR